MTEFKFDYEAKIATLEAENAKLRDTLTDVVAMLGEMVGDTEHDPPRSTPEEVYRAVSGYVIEAGLHPERPTPRRQLEAENAALEAENAALRKRVESLRDGLCAMKDSDPFRDGKGFPLTDFAAYRIKAEQLLTTDDQAKEGTA